MAQGLGYGSLWVMRVNDFGEDVDSVIAKMYEL
jgi:hypothetical protein